jgi:NADH-quinone oxidoreductase subunit J
MTTAVFAIVAVVTLLSAVFVVRSRNLVHAVMWLAASLLGTAALFALLDAPFLSGIQVLTYVGGVVTLMIFGVMITRKHDGSVIPAGGANVVRGALAAIGLFAVLFVALRNTDLTTGDAPPPPTTREMGHALLDENLFAFEVASVLLLAAIVGAVVLVRRRDHEAGAERETAGTGGMPADGPREGGLTS